MKKAITACLVLLVTMGLMVQGCDSGVGKNRCSSDDDYPDSLGNFQGAICVDGYAQCKDGSELCSYYEEDATGERHLYWGCNPSKCIYCPEDKWLCGHFEDPDGNPHDWAICVDELAECWY